MLRAYLASAWVPGEQDGVRRGDDGPRLQATLHRANGTGACRATCVMRAAIHSSHRTTLFLSVVATVAWWPALSGEFHYDDLANVVLDPATSDPAMLLDRLANGFRPLLRLSFVVDQRTWGLVPIGFIATNLLLHALTVLAVAALARRRLGSEVAVALAATIFALQPAHAMAVAWTSGRSTVLSTALMLAAMLAHERAVGSIRWRSLSLLLMALAVLAKETALVLPALLLLWEATRPAPIATRELLARVAPAAFMALLLAAGAWCASARLQEIIAFSLALSSPVESLVANAAALPISLSLWWRPWALAVEHPQGFTSAATLAGAATLLAMVVGAAAAMRARATLVALALLWPIVALLPTHSVLARLDPITEKALYAAWVGPSLALGAGMAWVVQTRPRIRPQLVTVLVLLLGGLCGWRASVWADPTALWREASERAPQSARAWSNRALAELGAGQLRMASQSIGRAQALAPGDERIHAAALAVSLASPPTEETRK